MKLKKNILILLLCRWIKLDTKKGDSPPSSMTMVKDETAIFGKIQSKRF
jgi:hypothetical protein